MIFFDEFPAVNKADWLARIAKDLKGKPLADLTWHPAPGIAADPFGHADDFAAAPQVLETVPNNWEICEDVPAADPAKAHVQALEALHFGAEGLRFSFATIPDDADFATIFQGIYLDFIGLHFAGAAVTENPGAFLALLQAQAQASGLDPKTLRGSLAYDPAALSGLHDWRYLADLLAFAEQSFPGFRLISVDGRSAHTGTEGVADELAALLRGGNTYLEQLSKKGVSPEKTAATMQFTIAVGKSYFLEIAKIRAFKLLWLNVLKGWGAPLRLPFVEAVFAPAAYSDDLYTNMVRGTTMAMSAVLGGAARLTVLPYDAEREALAQYPPQFSRRIARNVQHLLKMESGLHEIPDAAAGSYYIEQLVGEIARAAWEKFRTHS